VLPEQLAAHDHALDLAGAAGFWSACTRLTNVLHVQKYPWLLSFINKIVAATGSSP